MADQGQPLMTVPQTNLFGAAADDISSILANREVQKRKQMLEDLKAQIELQKSNNETATTQSNIATQAQQRGIAARKEQPDLDHLGAETQALADQHAKSVSDLEKQTLLRKAMDEFDAATTPEARVRAAAKVAGYGGHLMTQDEVAALNAPTNQAAIEKLISAYAFEKDPDKKQAIGMQIANLGGKGVATPDATPYQPVGNGEAIVDTRTGSLRQTGFQPTTAAKAPMDPQVVEGALNSIRASGTTTGIPADVYRAAIALAQSRGETIIPLTAASRNMREIAGSVGSKFDDLLASAQRVKDMGLFGTINGRLRNSAAGESLSADLQGLTPEQRQAIGDFQTRAGLFTSGAMLAHFRSRGGEAAYNIMKPLLAPDAKDFETYLGNIKAAKDVLDGYAHQGGVQPTVGAGKGGGPGVGAAPAAVDPNNPLGLPRIK